MSPRAAMTPPASGVRSPLGSTGATPQAKRPANRDAVPLGQAQVHHTMSVDDLTAAFFSLNQRLDREEHWAGMIHVVVDENAALLTQTISECQSLARTIKSNGEGAAATSLKVTADVRTALDELRAAQDALSATDQQRDSDLRNELNGLAKALEAGHAKLEAMIASVAHTAGIAKADLPPGLDSMGEKIGAIEAVNATLAQRTSGLETAQGQLGGRVHHVESTLTTHESAIKDAQSKIDTIGRRGVDPMAGASDPWAGGKSTEDVDNLPRRSPEQFDMSGEPRAHRPGGWKLYDEKYLFQSSSAYTGKGAAGWLLELRDYLAGRTDELDKLFSFLEKAADPVGNDLGWMLQCASNEEVSRQLWALLAALLKNDTDSMRKFRNVERHCGFRAWQVMAGGINEEKAELRRDLLSKVTNPRAATSVNDVERALEDWRTTKRIFTEADGKLPDGETLHLAFLGMLPQEVYTYVALHLDSGEFGTADKLEKFVLKYVKLLQARKRPAAGPAHLIDSESQEASSHLADEPGGGETHAGDVDQEVFYQVAELL